MRTKTLLLSAALVAAGALSSMAQSSVYSLNVVGYVTVTVPAFNGSQNTFAMLANPLDDGKGNYLTNVMSGDDGSGNFALIADGTSIFAWNTNTSSYKSEIPSFVQGPGGGWGSSMQMPVGNGFWIQSGTGDGSGPSFTITFVGNVQQGAVSSLLSPSITLAGSQIPVAIPVGSKGDINTAGPNDPTAPTLQMPTFDGDSVFIYTNNASSSGYAGDIPNYQFGTGWASSVYTTAGPVLQPAQAAWFYRATEDADASGNPSTATANGTQNWAYSFTVQ